MTTSIIDKYLNIPFKEGGEDFDGVYCYGLCQLFCRTEFGIILPEINKVSEVVDPIERPEKYCFVSFSEPKCEIETHVGIMINDIQFVHISNNLKRATPFPVLDKITDRLWRGRFKKFYRIKKDVKINRI